MSPERWSQVKTLLERVLARPAHEREEFLRHAALGDDELYDEVSASCRSARQLIRIFRRSIGHGAGRPGNK